MLFKLHFLLQYAGWCASTILLGVFVYEYTDASHLEMGYLFMLMPFIRVISRPIISAAADRSAAHKKYLIRSASLVAVCHLPFVIIPFLGPQIHVSHARACWWIVVVSKILGDVAMSGCNSIGDALAMNYARRLGVEFMVYRVWGTISWMSFGLLIGRINELSFLPKYTPGFMILVAAFQLNAIVLWLWPDEYFRMIPMDQIKIDQLSRQDQQVPDHLKCLLPKELILAHMLHRLRGLFWPKKRSVEKQIEAPRTEQEVEIETTKQSKCHEVQQVAKMTQLKILLLLLRRDPRVVLYLTFLVGMGVMLSPENFFFVGLADRCQEGLCNFSQLAGSLQFVMAAAETLLFISIKPLKARFGRVSFCAMAAFLAAFEFSVYANYWYTINPYFVVLINSVRGVYFGTSVVLMTDIAFVFANEVTFLLPELSQRGLIGDTSESQSERLKLSLSATMQAITSTANDGLGRGLGALVCGLVIDSYSYETLWMMLMILGITVTMGCWLVLIFDKLMKPNLGLDVHAELSLEDPGLNNKTKGVLEIV